MIQKVEGSTTTNYTYASYNRLSSAGNATNLNAAVLPPTLMNYNSTDGVAASVPYNATLYNGTIITVGGSPKAGLSPDAAMYSRPYIGGYMTANGCQPNNYCTATAGKGEISFPGTSASVIPSGNFLEGTLNFKSDDCCHNGIDYAIRSAHVLYPDGTHGVVADMWKVCEGITYGCGVASATELTAFILDIYGLSNSQPIYLQIQTTSTTIYWLYSYDGVNWMQYYSYVPPSSFTHDLYLGTDTIIDYPYFTAYFYQFGVWAQSAFYATLNVDFQNPSYYRNWAWTAIPTAESIYGPHSYIDNTWTYSSSTWYLDATVQNSSPTTTFYYSSCCYLAENIHLWG